MDIIKLSLRTRGFLVSIILAAFANYAFAATFVNVNASATGGAGAKASPWTGWDAAIPWTPGVTYNFPAGWYSYSGHHRSGRNPICS